MGVSNNDLDPWKSVSRALTISVLDLVVFPQGVLCVYAKYSDDLKMGDNDLDPWNCVSRGLTLR